MSLTRSILTKVKIVAKAVKGSLTYRTYDSDKYWRRRASCNDTQAVLWPNTHYNKCLREREFEVIKKIVDDYKIKKTLMVLDVGCGRGDVSQSLATLGFKKVHAIDFPEMVELAKKVNPHPNITYMANAAQDYLSDEKYGLIISSGTFSVIRDIPTMFKAIDNSIRMLDDGGYMLMIDPYHKGNLLARARISPDEIIGHLESKGLVALVKSGILFWPIRIWAASDITLSQSQTEELFQWGERILGKLGSYAWSDYKILLFWRRGEK
jgi:2-polyprenyl-3-methyl-5-hydroxy-6-metoxy-1,4-benzoquinol methylase